MDTNENTIKGYFTENFIFFSAGWFWLISIIYIFGGLATANYGTNIRFESILCGSVFFNLISLTFSFIFAIYEFRKHN